MQSSHGLYDQQYKLKTIYSTKLSDNNSNRKFVNVENMSFIEGRVKYNDTDADLSNSDSYTNYTVITPARCAETWVNYQQHINKSTTNQITNHKVTTSSNTFQTT